MVKIDVGSGSKRDEYCENSSDGEDEDARGSQSVLAHEEQLRQRDRDDMALHKRAQLSPAFMRQPSFSGTKEARVLSFYSDAQNPGRKKKQKHKKMLTCDQLSDLFRRLDRNGNGTLEKYEFMDIVKKLGLNVSEQFLMSVFQEVDSKTKTKGTLSLRDFIQCYQILYYETTHKGNKTFNSNTISTRYLNAASSSAILVEVICAVRYGHDSSADAFSFEIYTGNNLSGGMVFYEKKTFTGCSLGEYHKEEVDLDMSHLNLLIAEDSLHNSQCNSKLYWWIDVTLELVQPSTVEKYIINFGLPNDTRFRSRFSQFGDPLPKESNCNFHAGNGDTTLGSTSALSLFIQAIWMNYLPLVYNTAPKSYFSQKWSEVVDPGLQEWIKYYYDTRFSFMLGAFVSAPPSQRVPAYDSARSLSKRFHEAADLDIEYFDDEEEKVEDENFSKRAMHIQKPDSSDDSSLFSSFLHYFRRKNKRHRIAMEKSIELDKKIMSKNVSDDALCDPPLFVPPNHRTDEPTWLQDTNALRKITSRLVFETMGIHMIDMGSGPILTMTIRQMDDEGEEAREVELELKKNNDAKAAMRSISRRVSLEGRSSREERGEDSSEQQKNESSRSCRMQQQRKAKLMARSCRGILGRLLVGIRRKLLQNFYCKGVTAFAPDIADGPFDLMVYITSLVNNFSMNTMGHLENWKVRLENEVYDLAVSKHITHSHDLMEVIGHIKEYVDHFHDKIESFSVEAANEEAAQSLVDEVGHHNNANYSEKTAEVRRKLSVNGRWNILRVVRKVVDTAVHTHSIFPKGIEGTDLTFDMIKPFFGKNRLGNLNSLIYGNENLELTGLQYWKHRMFVLHESSSSIVQDIRESLDEKRNFYNYVLAVVTVFLGPMTILTGYWGMNFENMPELSPDYYTNFPGVKLLWAWGGLLYGIFFLLAIHYRIIYSAT